MAHFKKEKKGNNDLVNNDNDLHTITMFKLKQTQF